MKIFSSIIAVLLLGACAEMPIQVNGHEIDLSPKNPEVRLSLDEQFLKKSQDGKATAARNDQKKVFFNP